MLDHHTFVTASPEPATYQFGRFVLRGQQRLLLFDERPVELGSRAFEVLTMLVESMGALVSKAAIFDRVWAGLAVEDNNLQVQISTLRRILGADRDWIVTIPGQGYRFTAPILVMPRTAPAEPAPAFVHGPIGVSVLVLPFVNRGDPSANWFADGITDSLTTDLTRALPGSTVIAQTTAGAYKDRPVDVREIGRAVGVRLVVEGSIMQASGCVRVNAQLIETETGAHIWAERFDKPTGQVLELQDEIVARLTRAIGLQMVAYEARRAEQVEHAHPDASTAVDYVLRGHAAAAQRLSNPMRFDVALSLYARALELDPHNEDALTGIASIRVYQVVNCYFDGGPGGHDKAPAREVLLADADAKLARVLAVSPSNLAALKTRAVLLRARGAFLDALTASETVLAHVPSDPMGYREVGLNMLYLGRTEEAVTWFHRADAVNPGDPMRWTWLQGLGRALIQLGQDGAAAEALRQAIESNPAFTPSYAYLAAALALSGDLDRARLEMAEFRNAEPDTTLDVLAHRSPVPADATARTYQVQNERVLDGLRKAGLT